MKRPRIAITMGDPAGVGPELCIRALQDPHMMSLCQPIFFGDRLVLRRVAKVLEVSCDLIDRLPILESESSDGAWYGPSLVELPAEELQDMQPGVVSAATGAAAARYITAATQAAIQGHVQGIVTCPIHKEAFHAAGVPYAGHTDMLADLTGCANYCMTLTSQEITCALVTTHIGLRDVPSQLTKEHVLRVIRLIDQWLRRIRCAQPRLTVCALNPHAGEHGLFGDREEERVIAPAVEAAVSEGICAIGPVPPDTAFVPQLRAKTDAFICMYHDQGLIPLKALAFDTAINVTVGLPILRASVDHGTALDIAWKGQVKTSSFLEAIRWVAQAALDSGQRSTG